MERRRSPNPRSDNSTRITLEPPSGVDAWSSDRFDQRFKIVVEVSGACERRSTLDLRPSFLYSSADADRRVAGGRSVTSVEICKEALG